MARVDPAVDDPDLHALTGRVQRGPPERRSADLLWRAVELRAVGAPRGAPRAHPEALASRATCELGTETENPFATSR